MSGGYASRGGYVMGGTVAVPSRGFFYYDEFPFVMPTTIIIQNGIRHDLAFYRMNPGAYWIDLQRWPNRFPSHAHTFWRQHQPRPRPPGWRPPPPPPVRPVPPIAPLPPQRPGMRPPAPPPARPVPPLPPGQRPPTQPGRPVPTPQPPSRPSVQRPAPAPTPAPPSRPSQPSQPSQPSRPSQPSVQQPSRPSAPAERPSRNDDRDRDQTPTRGGSRR